MKNTGRKNPAGTEQKRTITIPSSGKFKTKCMFKGDWDFQISHLVKNPEGTDI